MAAECLGAAAPVGQGGAGDLPDRVHRRHGCSRQDLARAGLHAYAGFPSVPLRVFFVSLVLLDPLVVALCAFARPSGVWLAAVVIVLATAPALLRVTRPAGPPGGPQSRARQGRA